MPAVDTAKWPIFKKGDDMPLFRLGDKQPQLGKNAWVAPNATVIGDIRDGFVTIPVAVEGNVLAADRCALRAGASLQGDIESPRLAMDENASLVGSATIKATAPN